MRLSLAAKCKLAIRTCALVTVAACLCWHTTASALADSELRNPSAALVFESASKEVTVVLPPHAKSFEVSVNASKPLPLLALDDTHVWSQQFDRAMKLQAEGKLTEAAASLQQILQSPGKSEAASTAQSATVSQQTRFAPDDRQYGQTLYSCYSLYMIMKDWAAAATVFKQAIKTDSRSHPRRLADVGSDLLDLANCQYQLKQYKKAAGHCQRALKIRMTVYGPDSPYVGAVQWRYAKALRALGQWQAASKLANDSYSTLPICAKCNTNEGVSPIYYGEKSYVASPREFIRMDYFDGGKISNSHSPNFWCTKCNTTFLKRNSASTGD